MKKQHREAGMSSPQYLFCVMFGYVTVWLLISSVGCISAEQVDQLVSNGFKAGATGATAEAVRQLVGGGGIDSWEAIGGGALGGVLAWISAYLGKEKVKKWRKNGNGQSE